MKDFIFDLQRFDTKWTINSNTETKNDLQSALTAAKDGDTLNLITKSGASIQNTNQTINKNVTLNLNTYNLSIDSSITIDSGKTLTLAGASSATENRGTFTAPSESSKFTNNGTLIIENLILNNPPNINGINSITNSIINISKDKNFKYGNYTYTAIKALTLEYNESGNPFVTGLKSNDTFSIKDKNDITTTYNVNTYGSNTYLSATTNEPDSKTRYYLTKIESSPSLAVDSIAYDNLQELLLISDGKITLSSGVLDSISANTSVYVVQSGNFDSRYGAITHDGLNAVTLSADDRNATLTNISIDGATAAFDSVFANIPITVSGGTIFKTTDTNAYTVGNDSDFVVSIDGSGEVSLRAGSLQAANSQNVTADAKTVVRDGNNSIYSVGANSDGMNFSVDSSGNLTLGGLSTTDTDSFTVGGASYSVRSLGFIKQTDGNAYKIYYSSNSHSLAGDSIAANDLSGNDWLDVISVSGGAATIPENASNAVFVENFKTKYGTLTASGGNYTLTRGSDSLLSTLSITSNTATLSAGESLNNLQIQNDVASIKIADDSTGGYSVTLNGAASVSGASAVTLLGGAAQLDSSTPYYVGSTSFGAIESALISLSVDDSSTTISGIDSGESFNVGGTSYTLLGNGRFQRSDNSIWKADTIDGSVTFASLTADANWYGIVNAVSGVLTIDNLPASGTTAYVVEETDHSKIYGTLSRENSNYTLGKDNATTATATAISIGGGTKNVSLSADFLNTSITAGTTATFQVTSTTDNDGFTVNYASTATSITSASAAITLLDGTLTLGDKTQTVKAGEKTSINALSGTVTATYEEDTLTVGSIDTVGDSVKLGNKIYTLTKGGISIKVTSSGTTITGIDDDDKFSILGDSKNNFFYINKYFVRQNGENYYLYKDNINGSLTVDDLTTYDNWQGILPAQGGNLTVDTATIQNVSNTLRVADISNLSDSLTLYGTLSKSSSTYTLSIASDDILPASITLTGTKIILPADYSNNIISGGATFNADSSDKFTVDATGTYPSISTDVSLITVTAGEIQAAKNQSIVVGSKTVVATSGDMTVGVSGTSGFVGNLNIGDAFTVDGTAYEVTAAGLFDAKNKRLVQNVTTTYNLDDAAQDIIAIKGTTLDLTAQSTDALVYDSITNPTTFLATFTAGAVMTLAGEDVAASKIKTVKIAKNTSIDVDFATQVNAAAGTAVVNGQTYAGSTSLVIQSDGSSSTLYGGTVKLETGTSSVTADITASVANGSITATASGGTLTSIGALDAADSFTVSGTTYTQSAVGLLQGGKISVALAGTSVKVANLATATFSDMTALSDGVLNLNGAITSVVVDNPSNPTQILGNLTVNDTDYIVDFATKATVGGNVTVNGQYYSTVGTVTLTTTATSSSLYEGTINLTSEVTATAKAGKFISVGNIDSGDSFSLNGSNYVMTSIGLLKDGALVTNGYNTGTLTLADIKTSPLITPTDGTIDLSGKTSAVVVDNLTAPTKILGNLTVDGSTYTLDFETQVKISSAATVNGQSYSPVGTVTLSTTATDSALYDGTIKLGNVTQTAKAGEIVSFGNIDAGDSFSYADSDYVMTDIGLLKDGALVTAGFKSGTLTLANVQTAPLIAPKNGVIDLPNHSATVVDDSDNPKQILGNLTADATTYKLDFAAKVRTSNAVTVNGQTYSPVDDIIIISTTPKTSSLYEGTINFGNVTLTADAGEIISVGNINAGDTFTLNVTYTATPAGLFTGNKIVTAGYSDGTLTLADIETSPIVAPENGIIELPNTSAVAVNSLTNPTKVLGNITADDSTYTLDFAAQVQTSGSVTVNGQSYTSTDDIILDTTATTSTLKSGTVYLGAGDKVLTSSGNSVVATDGEFTLTAGDTLTFGSLNAGDGFTLDGKEYARTSLGLFRVNVDDQDIYTANLGSQITSTQLAGSDWSPIITITGGNLNITGDLESAIILSDDLTKRYAALTKDSNGYTLSDPVTSLNSIAVTDVKATLAAAFATVPITADDTKISNLTLTAKKTTFTVDASGDLPTLSDVQAFTLNAGSVNVSAGQSVTAGDNSFVANTGSFVLNENSIRQINGSDTFTLNDSDFALTSIGLITNGELVTNGFSDGNLNITDIQTTPLIAPTDSIITLPNTDCVAVDNLTSPTKILGNVTVENSAYNLDFAAQVQASGNVTINGQSYSSADDIIIDTTATTSTLKSGTVTLASGNSVTTSSGTTATASAGSITVTAAGSVTIGDLTAGDEFKIGTDAYKVSAVAPINSAGKLWTGKDFSEGLTPAELATASNWSVMSAVEDGKLSLDKRTLANGESVVLVDDTDNPTKIYGELSKANDVYTLDYDNATDKLNAIAVDKTAAHIDNDLAGVQITTISLDGNQTVFSVKASENTDFYFVDATGNTTQIDDAGEINIISGKLSGGESAVVPEEGAENVELVLDNGNHTVSDEKITVTGLDDDQTISATTDDQGNINQISGMPEGSSVTIDGTTYTAPEDDSTLSYSDADGWYFEDYELDEYTVNVNRRGNVSVDAGVKLTNVVESGKTVDDGSVTLAVNTAQIPVTVNNDSSGNLKVSDEDGTLIEKLSKGATAEIERNDNEIVLTVSDEADLTLNAGEYSINGVEFTAGGKTQLTTSSGGVEIDLSKSGAITVDGKTISGSGTLTATADKVLVEGSVTIGDVKIISDEAVDVSIVDDLPYSGQATYTVEDGKIATAQISDTLSGDFSGGLIVNGNGVTVKGTEATVSADGEITAGAGNVTVNGHGFSSTDEVTFQTKNGSVTGADIADGTLVLKQNESNFALNSTTLNLSGNTTPVSLNVADGSVTAASGVNGSIDGLKDATVYDAGKATINGKKISVTGSDCAAVVSDGEAVGLVGITSGATISSAPNMTVSTTSGDLTFGDKTYHISDDDNALQIATDAYGGASDITNFAGDISGAVGALTLNGKDFGTNNAGVTVTSDGTNITAVTGIKSGDSIGGDLDEISFTLPRGNVTINDNKLTLRGEAGVQVSNGGKTITGLDKDSSLSASAGGVYNVNGKRFAAGADTSFTVNRDGAYAINAPNYLPIIEDTPAEVVTSRGYVLKDGNGTVAGENVAVRGGANVTVEVDGTNLIATSGSVTLENYNEENATVQTYEYTNISGAVIGNRIEFGNGTMTLGDAVITFNADSPSRGSTMSRLVNAVGRGLDVGFTHSAGGTVDASESDVALLKGNYRTERGQLNKTGASSLKGGAGNDTLLIGGNDTADAGAGNNVIYITDSRLKDSAATIRLSEGKTRVMNFNAGFATASDKILVSSIANLNFSQSGSQFVLESSTGQIILESFGTSADLAFSADKTGDVYKLKLSDGTKDYNAAISTNDAQISVSDDEVANLFYGSDVTFSEYSGAVNVNLSTGTGSVGKNSAVLYGVNKLEGGKGNSQLTGSGAAETLIAGTGNGSLNGGGGADLLIGRGDKDGSTTFYYLADGGYDTISGFAFGASGDLIDITRANAVTDVWLDGDNVIMRINHNDDDKLTLADAKGERFQINNLLAKVDGDISYDAFTNCYVADATNATMTVGRDVGDADIWLNDKTGGLHGKYYLGEITVLDARTATGSNILTGNDLNNVVYGGLGDNSIWGGHGYNNDTLVGGRGHNTFCFTQVNGSDVVEGAHDGDVINLGTVYLNQVKATEITADGATVILEDNSRLTVNSNANIEYRLHDGTYIADHNTGVWNKK